MRFVKALLVILLVTSFAILYTQNLEVFTHKFELRFDLRAYSIGPYLTTNIVIIVCSFVIGGLLALLMGVFQTVSNRSTLKNRIRQLEAELKQTTQSQKESADPGVNKEGNREKTASFSPFSTP